MCDSAPTAQACWRDAQAFETGLYYLGICGDYRHSQKQSGHNCAQAPGGNESAIDGVDYSPDYCHALDIGHGGDRAKATRIRAALLPDTRVRYVIDNGIGYYPPHRGGATFTSSGHETHVHVSFMPGSTHNANPYFGHTPVPPIRWPLGKDDNNLGVLVVEIALVHCGFADIVVDGRLGEATLDASQQMQRFLKRRVRPKAITRGDAQAFGNWVKLAGSGHRDQVLTIGDQGPLIRELRTHLRKVGQPVDPTGKYDTKVQEAMRNVQRFFNSNHKAGNASREDRELLRSLASGR